MSEAICSWDTLSADPYVTFSTVKDAAFDNVISLFFLAAIALYTSVLPSLGKPDLVEVTFVAASTSFTDIIVALLTASCIWLLVWGPSLATDHTASLFCLDPLAVKLAYPSLRWVIWIIPLDRTELVAVVWLVCAIVRVFSREDMVLSLLTC